MTSAITIRHPSSSFQKQFAYTGNVSALFEKRRRSDPFTAHDTQEPRFTVNCSKNGLNGILNTYFCVEQNKGHSFVWIFTGKSKNIRTTNNSICIQILKDVKIKFTLEENILKTYF